LLRIHEQLVQVDDCDAGARRLNFKPKAVGTAWHDHVGVDDDSSASPTGRSSDVPAILAATRDSLQNELVAG
jgi:hypothetical protein